MVNNSTPLGYLQPLTMLVWQTGNEIYCISMFLVLEDNKFNSFNLSNMSELDLQADIFTVFNLRLIGLNFAELCHKIIKKKCIMSILSPIHGYPAKSRSASKCRLRTSFNLFAWGEENIWTNRLSLKDDRYQNDFK